MEGERPHRSSSELFICFTSRASSSSSSMKLSSKSILSPGRTDKLREPLSSLPSSLSRRLKSNGSIKGGHSSPMFPTGSKKKGCVFETPEPSSPKVTCIGKVRVKTKKHGKKMRTRSKRMGEVSFRKTEQGQQQESLPNNRHHQRWVHLPLSICEGLRAFGSEFNCFLPCGGRSWCGSNAAMERQKGEKRRTSSSCGVVFAKWLVGLQEGEVEKKREMEENTGLVVAQKEDDQEKREAMVEEKGEERKEEMEEEEEEEDVSICIPPRNALLLMRCRSEPLRRSSFASRFWDSPAPKEEDEDDDEGEEEESGEDERDEEEEDEDEVVVQISEEEKEEDEHREEERFEQEVSAEVIEEHENPQNGKEKEDPEEEEKEDEEEEEEEKVEIVSTGEGLDEPESKLGEEKEEEKEIQLQKSKEEEEKKVEIVSTGEGLDEPESKLGDEKEEEKEIQLQKSKEEEEEVVEKEIKEKEEEERRSSYWSSQAVQLVEEVTATATLEEEEGGEKSTTTTTAEEEKEMSEERVGAEEEMSIEMSEEKEEEREKGLPDCLLLMMYEPKLSMEVSKETWVCSTDFRQQRRPEKRERKGKEVKEEESRRRMSVDCKPTHPPHAPSMAVAIEQKLLNSEPFVLTRCRSEPISSSSSTNLPPDHPCFWKTRDKLQPHRPSVGAAGLGF
ncbi:serine/Threonine-kinase pakA-like protein [Tasmannia lanceolata]|uniref:serine/Threonine-kinase pakA-like protein n=1 Tax=Tasmannia lanceolata TaxID=3420 RepID=UPI00406295E1